MDAILQQTLGLLPQPLIRINGSNSARAVLLFTDGVDTASDQKLNLVIQQAIAAQVRVYVVGMKYKDEWHEVDQAKLKKISEQTGGAAFFFDAPRTEKEKSRIMPVLLAQLDYLLHNHYVLSYQPSVAKEHGKPQKIKLEVAASSPSRKKVELSYPRFAVALPPK